MLTVTDEKAHKVACMAENNATSLDYMNYDMDQTAMPLWLSVMLICHSHGRFTN